MKKVMALVLALVLVLSLAACGGSGSEDDTSSNANTNTIVGKWKLSSSDLSQIVEHAKKLPAGNIGGDLSTINQDGIIEFFEDGSCNVGIDLCYFYRGDTSLLSSKYSSYYTKQNGRVYLSQEAIKYDDYKYEISGNQLIITLNPYNPISPDGFENLQETLTYDRIE